jgi:hypothetical protein
MLWCRKVRFKLIMPYSSFTIAQVKRQFNLNIIKGAFFADLPLLAPRTWFREYLQESASFAAGQGSEKVRSELIVAPLLFELRILLDRQIGFFSGIDFTIDVESGLNGVCDFLLTRSTDELTIEAPAIVLIEAKKGELNGGWGQCAAEMIAAQKFNLANEREVPTIYGSVTTGIQWQFLKLAGTNLTIDTTEYSLDPFAERTGGNRSHFRYFEVDDGERCCLKLGYFDRLHISSLSPRRRTLNR